MNIPCNENDRLTPPADTRPRVDEALYQGLHPYVESAKALARLTYKSLYIIDYNKLNFLYISSNPLFLCGESVDEVMREGYQVLLSSCARGGFSVSSASQSSGL